MRKSWHLDQSYKRTANPEPTQGRRIEQEKGLGWPSLISVGQFGPQAANHVTHIEINFTAEEEAQASPHDQLESRQGGEQVPGQYRRHDHGHAEAAAHYEDWTLQRDLGHQEEN